MGKYAMSFLKQFERQLGAHAVLVVTYKNTQGEVKISEYVSSKGNELN